MTKTKILVVEDEAITALFIEQCLESLGYEVIDTAISGEEALEKISRNRPDLILMDIMLDGEKTGIETAEEVYKNFDIPVIFLTAYSDTQTLKKAVNTGSFGYILKPVEEKSLRPAIEIALNKYREENALKISHTWLNTMIENIGDTIIATDFSHNIRFVNREAEKLLGQDSSSLAGKDIFKVLNIASGISKDVRKEIDEQFSEKTSGKISFQVKLQSENINTDVSFLSNQNGEKIGLIFNLSFEHTGSRKSKKSSLPEEDQIKKLRDLLGICSFCKKIKDEENHWNKLEEYLQQVYNFKFSHGVCPDCARHYYSEVYKP